MRLRPLWLVLNIVVAVQAFSQTATPADPTPLKTLPPGWEQIDQRLVFLTVELSNTETSLAAVNKAIRVNGYNQSVKQNQAQTVRRGNEVMDRNAGGPVSWESFYGRTAEKFFYHPTDPNSHYITRTDLTQTDPRRDVSAGDGVPSRQGLPLQQRPPQFDYIYRANASAGARAEQEAAALGNKVGALLNRRQQLEAEQSSLWCKISFQALATRKLLKKPLYRFGLRTTGTDKKSVQQLEACKASAEFVSRADRLAAEAMETVDQNQSGTLSRLHDGIASAYQELDKKLDAQRQVAVELVDQTTPVGKLYALSSRMDDTTKNMVDALKLSEQGEQTKDDQRKTPFVPWCRSRY